MSALSIIVEVVAIWVALACICALFLGRFIRFGMGDHNDR